MCKLYHNPERVNKVFEFFFKKIRLCMKTWTEFIMNLDSQRNTGFLVFTVILEILILSQKLLKENIRYYVKCMLDIKKNSLHCPTEFSFYIIVLFYYKSGIPLVKQN